MGRDGTAGLASGSSVPLGLPLKMCMFLRVAVTRGIASVWEIEVGVGDSHPIVCRTVPYNKE